MDPLTGYTNCKKLTVGPGGPIGPAYETPETSYLSVAAADTLAASRPTNTAWAAATSAQKLAALEEATRRIDGMILRGDKYD